jgi:hypothetical protein
MNNERVGRFLFSARFSSIVIAKLWAAYDQLTFGLTG